MPCRLRLFPFAIGMLIFCLPYGSARAQAVSGSHARPLVTQNIDEEKLVTLHGNTRPEATPENDRGPVDDNTLLEHMMLQLRRPAEADEDLQEFLEDLNKVGSPNFHRWISAREFGERFGPSDRDLDKVTDWLEAHRFKVNVVYPSGMVIDFTGTAGQVRKAFHTEIHQLNVRGEKHFANMRNAQIPAALAPLIVGIVSLHNFSPHALHQMRHQFTFPDPLGGQTFALVPADLATIYNLNPVFNAGNSGQGQTIALIEDTDVFTLSDWNSFRSAFGLSKYTSGTISAVHPAPPNGTNNCSKPGVIAPNDAEAILDGEWASAAAPSATIEMVSCADTTATFGGLIAVQNLINAKSGPPSIMSISYGQCEAVNGAAANAAYYSAYQQAAAEGVSVFVAAGDSGAAGCDNSVSEATSGIAVNAFASTPYNVAVGGTDFSDTYFGTNSSYWNSSNTPTFGSAISYIPEIPWNDSCAGALVSSFEGFSTTYGSTSLCNDPNLGPFLQTTVAGGGGPSGCATGTPSVTGVVSGTCKGWPKPSWQAVLGNPQDGVRDTPDVSLFAADGLWGHYYVFCWSDTANGGAACTGSPSNWSGAGGTSFASPIMAGIQALINQRAGASQGNPNPVYYSIAATEYGSGGNSSCNSSNGASVGNSCAFYDVTLGDMDVNCTGNHNCYLPSGSAGVLSTSNNSFAPAYGTTSGWDFATGIGSVNALNLVNSWPGTSPIQGFSLAASPNSATLVQGASTTSTISIAPFGGFNGIVTLSASGLPAGVTATFNPGNASTSSTLTLSASSTATAGAVSVLITGSSPGSLTSTTTLTLTVNVAPSFKLVASPSSISLTQGSSGTSTITVTPQNGFGGSVSLTASGLPSGVNAFFSSPSTTGASTLTLAASSTALSGGFTVIVTGVSGNLTQTVSISLAVATATSPLPTGWWDGDIGSVGLAGGATYTSGTFTVKASGQWIWSTADGMNFAYQPLSGDATIVARVLSTQGSTYPQAGVMIRETLTAGSSHAFVADQPYPGPGPSIYFYDRPSTGASSSSQATTSLVNALPYWVKLVRSGSTFTGYVSPDGSTWTQVGTAVTISMAQNVFIGLALTAGNNSVLATAMFDNVSISTAANPAPNITSISPASGPVGTPVVITGTGFGSPQGSQVTLNGAPVTINSWSPTSISITIPTGATSGPLVVTVAPSMTNSNPVTFTVSAPSTLPSPWLDQDVGAVSTAGSAAYSNGVFTVKASGQWIWSTADGMNFAYQPLSGDATIVARVLSTQGSTYPQAGVMIRETLTAGSSHAFVADQPYPGPGPSIYFYDRPSTGASSSSQATTSPVNALPYWVKLVRSGSTFTGYVSPDGSTWTQVGTAVTISMAQNVFIGLAVTAGNNSVLATAMFDNVSISTAANPAPNITSISPTSGPVGTPVVITGTGFGSPQGSQVTLNGAPVTINSWSPTSISITIPTGATSGPLVVTVAPSMMSSNPVTFTVSSSTLPGSWLDQDVGAVSTAGSATYSNGVFTVKASGQWIWSTADGMHYAYQPLAGDGTIVARVLSAQGSTYPEAGVMIRETLTAASTHAYVTYEPYPGPSIYFYDRPSTGTSTASQTTAVNALPYWVKLVRSGNNFTGYASTDGSTWVQVGTIQTISMAQNVYIGLAVSANNNNNPVLATATFDNVSVQ